MTTVISSMILSSSIHLLLAISISLSQASLGLPFFQYIPTVATARSLSMNSHNPSLASIINLSYSVNLPDLISGVAVSPIDYARRSPIERVMARPGTGGFLPGTQIRRGPMGCPSSSLKVSTTPPAFSITSLSAWTSGFWSVLSGTDSHITVPFRPSTARLSPTLAHINRSPRIKTETAVVPEF